MERLSADDPPEQWAIHSYRYRVAARFTRSSDIVLDSACGIGYGRQFLKGRWIGVDKEPGAGLVVDLCSWAPDFDYDVFVGLETIEHLDDFTAYVTAAQRAKRTIVISTPIIPTKHQNPWHVHDFTPESLEALFDGWSVAHYETQADPILGPDIYGIWAFER